MHIFVDFSLSAIEPIAKWHIEAWVAHDDGVDAFATEATLVHLNRDEAESFIAEVAADLVYDVKPLATAVDGFLAPGLAGHHVRVGFGLNNDSESTDGVLDLGARHHQTEVDLEVETVHHVSDDVIDHGLAHVELLPEEASGVEGHDRQSGGTRSADAEGREQEAAGLDGGIEGARPVHLDSAVVD
ncbi:hypothetical protein F5Y00DRAFT_238411 [Daldinia vernicosa]|uniref:uncharacterized protein n=1 Tax=Daldinia vernicosa TaxID=114800 RepID=UPI0020082B7C|nr:uncharacterized protein F5Y00DRAFT_238411 [Daldinia vernicosa]KAI0848472.1 hypothetical protein F5Y00DRAFT_238411 [Daldinia vernicosa]